MYYIVVRQSPHYHQMSLEEFLFGDTDNLKPVLITNNETNTRTYALEKISDKFSRFIDVDAIIDKLTAFNKQTESLHEVDRHSLYREFYIPKKSGGLRRIDAPEPLLMNALRTLKTIFEEDCKCLYHTSAFAYIKRRSTLDAVKRHQANESRWFAKYDLSDFFGSTTKEFVMKMFGMIFPFCMIVQDSNGKEQLSKALDLAFLDGGLPQGTPISPIITNVMMIPVDYIVFNRFRNFKYQKDGKEISTNCVYTRYADDFLVSSRYDFDFRQAEQLIVDTLASFDAPFTIKKQKTRYGSSAGSNWNLGVMLNKDNNITIGYQRKKRFIAMISSYIMDRKNGVVWDKNDIQVMEGYRNYYRMIERDNIDGLIAHLSEKFNVDIIAAIKEDLRA